MEMQDGEEGGGGEQKRVVVGGYGLQTYGFFLVI